MTQNQGKTILITGANTGLGKEMARQLALREDFERIYLGCRNPEKAERAKEDLETVSGRTDLRGSDHRPGRPSVGTCCGGRDRRSAERPRDERRRHRRPHASIVDARWGD